ncbi:MAG: hypothetical protein QG564_1275 [Campylobacterota bacterium]|nr:hypothetical protein [Campylobacterota bacterium]
MKKLHYIKDEMLVHIPICTHAQPKNILIVGGCDKIKNEVEKHKSLENILILKEDIADQMTGLGEHFFDVAIVVDENFRTDRIFWGLLHKALHPKGVVSTVASTMLVQEEAFEEELKTVGELFKIVMPYCYEEMGENGYLLCKNLLLASKAYHPTADINLQRADLTDELNYYNSDIAIGAFQVPTISKKRFAGLIKF